MAYSDELHRKAKNMSPGWARGFIKASADIERGKEFKKAWGLDNSSNVFSPPSRKSNNSSSGSYSTNQFRQTNTFPSKHINTSSSYTYRRSLGSRIAGAFKFLFKLIFWFVVAVVALAFYVNYMGSHH